MVNLFCCCDAVLYRDLPKYNDRRRNLWLPAVVHQHSMHALRRTISNPSLYGLSFGHSDSSREPDIPDWHSEIYDDELLVSRRRRRRQVDSLSISNSTASFPSNNHHRSSLVSLRVVVQSKLIQCLLSHVVLVVETNYIFRLLIQFIGVSQLSLFKHYRRFSYTFAF